MRDSWQFRRQSGDLRQLLDVKYFIVIYGGTLQWIQQAPTRFAHVENAVASHVAYDEAVRSEAFFNFESLVL